MPLPAFGYILSSCPPASVPDFGANYRAEQCAIVQTYADQHNLSAHAIFFDSVEFARVPWLERPAGRQLAGQLVPGCEVIVADAAAIYTSAADLLSIIQSFQARGIVLHFARFQLPGNELDSLSTTGDMGEVLIKALTVMCSFGRSRRQAIAEGMARKKGQGRHCHWPGYGWKWTGRRGQERRVPDEEERTVIEKIIEWKEKGFSWCEIATHLLRCGVVANTGREWSVSRVRRAYIAEMRNRIAKESV